MKRVRIALRLLGSAGLVLLITVCLSEIASRVLLSRADFTFALRRFGPNGNRIDAMSRYAAVRKPGQITWTYGSYLEPDRELGWNNRPGAYLVDGNRYTISAQRLRSTREFASAKPAGVLRIETFGDSFTFGAEVGDDDSYPAQLQAGSPELEVLNFGVPGYGGDQTLLRFEGAGARFHPDLVIVHLMNFSARCTTDFGTWYKPWFETRGSQLVLRGVPVPTPEDELPAWRRGPRLLDVLSLTSARTIPGDVRVLSRRILARLAEAARASGARTLLVLSPMANGFTERALFDAACADRSVECLDLTGEFARAQGAGVALFAGVHYSRAGNAILAEHLRRRIADESGKPLRAE